ncbi:MAG: UDP-3-O-acyl-N-acetylglucosamine deacetylase [Bauldia sp.]|nr:UDP-3-O-acyl-N-acetylglucosamine deacetylase [Bauldia sp.]
MTARVLQTTISHPVNLSGVGIHCGQPATVRIVPAGADHGIVFRRARGGADTIRADVAHIGATDHCTTLVGDGWSVATVEHLLAALSGLEIDNALVEIDGPEVPAMDGSAAPFFEALDQAGIETLDAPRHFIRVTRAIRVELGRAAAEFRPGAQRRFEVELDFANPVVGRQTYAADLSPDLFRRDIGPARTFGFLAEAQALWSRGFALGASLDNALVVGDGHIVNPDGARFADEFARHKAVDAIGDLALAGAPILGTFHTHRGGHSLHALALKTLLATPDAYEILEQPAPRFGRLAGFSAAVYGPAVS